MHKSTRSFFQRFHKQYSEGETPEYITLLMSSFELRLEKNHKYSMRAFSRDLGLGVGHLSRILSGERVIRRTTLTHLLQRLNVPADDRTRYMAPLRKLHRRKRNQPEIRSV